MAIYRIFPEKDTFIYTEQVLGNAGKDQIVEIGGYPNSAGLGQTSRILTKFSTTEITNVIDNEIGSTNFSSSIKLYLAEASELPVEFTLYTYPISSSTEWDNGIGQYGDLPVNKTGVSWTNIQAGDLNPWQTSDWPAGVTASFISSKTGGGTWYTENNSESTEFSQSFNLNTDLDANINVTAAIKQIYNNQLTNRGFILKLQDDYEFYTTASIRLKYFSKDTNTIYPPFLEFGWDDRTYDQGDLSLLSTDICSIDIKNNKGVYADTGKQRFRISARPQYPTRAFTTSSVYLTNNVLPSASYWGLRDENTEEMIVDFNTDFTKISCDSNGSFFDVYMGGLQPERYYRILIKTEIDNSTIVLDNQNVFKVVRNG